MTWIEFLLYRSQMIHHCKFVAPFKQSSQSYWILVITWHSWRLSGNHGRPMCPRVVSSRPSGTSLYRMPERYVICDVTSAKGCPIGHDFNDWRPLHSYFTKSKGHKAGWIVFDIFSWQFISREEELKEKKSVVEESCIISEVIFLFDVTLQLLL